MSYNDLQCVVSAGNTGLANCKDNLGSDARLLWTTKSFEFASEADAEDESKYEDAINAKTMAPYPLFFEVEPAIEDNVKQDSATGSKIFVREGKYGGIGRFETAICNLERLRSRNEAVGRAFIITSNGKIYGTSPDGVIFRGFDLSEFHVSFLGGTDGSTARLIELDYQFQDPTQMGDYAAVPQTTWNPLSLNGIVDCEITVVSSTDALVVISIARDCDGEAVTGLVIGDFTMLASDGTTEMLPGDGVTETPNGTYSFVFSTPVLPADDYTIDLKTPATQTTGGYESEAAGTFTIV